MADYENQLSTPLAYASPEQIQAAYSAALKRQNESPPEGTPIRSWTQGVATLIDALATNKRFSDLYGLQRQAGSALSNALPDLPVGGAPSAAKPPGAPPIPGSTSINPTGGTSFENYAMRTSQIESGHNPASVSGKNRGIMQFSPDLETRYGVAPPNSPDHVATSIAGLKKEASEHAPILMRALGRVPTPGELYFMHQQGIAGGPALLTAGPNVPAWQAVRQFYPSESVAKQAINNNTYKDAPFYGREPSAQEFSQYWVHKFERGMGGAQQVSQNTPPTDQSASSSTAPTQVASTGPLPAGALQSPSAATAASPSALPMPTPAALSATGDAAGGGAPSVPPAGPQLAQATPSAAPSPAGGAGTPDFIPPTPGMPPLPTMDHIRQLMANPMTRGVGMQIYQDTAAKLQPQQINTPDGHVYVGNPYTGYHLSQIPGKPTIESGTVKAGGVEVPQKRQLILQPDGTYAERTLPVIPGQIATPSGAPPANSAPAAPSTQGAQSSGPGPVGFNEPMPTNGDPSAIAAWAARRELAMAGQKKQAEDQAASNVKYSDTVYRGLTGSAVIAAQQKPNINLIRTLAQDPHFLSGTFEKMSLETKRALSQAGINPGAAAPQEVLRQIAARILADQFSGMKSMASETGEQMGRIFSAMLTVEEKANIDPEDSVEGLLSKVNILDRAGDLMMKWGDMADDYKAEHGKLDEKFNKQIRAEMIKPENQILWGSVRAKRPTVEGTTEKPKTEPGTFKYDAQGKRIP